MADLTKKALAEVFLNLLETKTISQITIKEITAQCHINRMTFYYHFKDIYDLATWAISDSVENEVGKFSDYGNDLAKWYIALGHATLKHKTLVRNLLFSIPYENVVDHLYTLTAAVLNDLIVPYDPEGTMLPKDRSMLVDFLKCAIVGMELEWVRSGMKESPEEFTHRLQTVIHGQIPLAISNFAREREGKQ